MEEGRSYLVYIYLDEESGRIAATAKLNKFIGKTIPSYAPGEEVNLILESENDLGYTAIINNQHWGLLYENEVFEQLERGQQLKGYIKKVREDHRIDLSLYKPGYQRVDPAAQTILQLLKENNGFLAVTDKTDAEEIYNLLGFSKKTFKKAVGALYKQRMILIKDNGLQLKKKF
jgi:predicted RNA-binding protein (virulence factor B family)